jgi:glycosyltransferase involved in cell wall biosynthesis
MHFLTVTDAWHPQVNGVVRTIEATNRELQIAGHQTSVISPHGHFTLPCPRYSEIRLALLPYGRVASAIERARPDAIHLATEGPLGQAARRWCLRHAVPFTTAYHTRFPQYLRAMFGLPERYAYGFLRRFHGAAARVLSPTAEVDRELAAAGVQNIVRWTRGVDTDQFAPHARSESGLRRPLFLYVGRVSVEKNVGAFLALDLPGTKLVAGQGPALETLRRRYPEASFAGVLPPARLAQLYSEADVFVFPSRTDTYGLVMLEALACGTPVAAYPVQGPIDVLGGSGVAALDEDLRAAALHALKISRAACREFALQHSWRAATQQFIAHHAQLATADPQGLLAAL